MIHLDDYDYHLPQELIANTPASPRDAARLFVYDTATDTVSSDTFRNIGKHLPHPSLLVMNDTKVVPARLWLTKETGGKVAVLLLLNEYRTGDILLKGIVDRKLGVGAMLFFVSGATLQVVKQEEQFFFFRPSVPMSVFWTLLEREGNTPIPPYIKHATISEQKLRECYQSVLAKHPASVAAPTASLHFTKALLARISRKGVRRTNVTLHVGLGTFAPIGENNLRKKKLFEELYDISYKSADAINEATMAGVPVIPVGTTALRTLESAVGKNRGESLALPARPKSDAGGKGPASVVSGASKTNLFIYPPYNFKIADGLITNFHVPKSSLMLLVDALLVHKKARRRILDLYTIAIKEKFRFYSFGDGMLIR